jgi:hypothetical protein
VPVIDVTQLRLAPVKPTTTTTVKPTTTTTVKPTTTTTVQPTTIPTTGGHIVGAFQNANDTSEGVGGYVLYSNGKLNALNGAPSWGGARKSGLTNFVTMAQNAGEGYWLVTSTGKVYPYGVQDCSGDTIQQPSQVQLPIVGTLNLSSAASSNVDAGFQMVNASGTTYTWSCASGL